MGVYLYARSSAAEVKVSSVLARVVPVVSSPSGSMPASLFLEKLACVEEEFFSSPGWVSLATSGMKDHLDSRAQYVGLAGCADGGQVAVWFDQRRLADARALGEAALVGGVPVHWS